MSDLVFEPRSLNSGPTSRQFFEQKYRASPDPWSFETNDYELRRYAIILEHIEAGRFDSVFEPGCSIGVLTEQLAARCGRVLAVDIAPTAVVAARRRCADHENVTIEHGALPHALASGPFDLIVFSEIGYYFSEHELAVLVERMSRRLSAGGSLIAAHWTGRSNDHVLTGRQVHAFLHEHLEMEHVAHVDHSADDDVAAARTDGFVLDMWTAANATGKPIP